MRPLAARCLPFALEGGRMFAGAGHGGRGGWMTEPKLRVAIQGERGAFSHEAALLALGEGIEGVPRPSFETLFVAVVDGAADRAIVPIENSLAGSIHENYDRLKSGPLHIVGETQLS